MDDVEQALRRRYINVQVTTERVVYKCKVWKNYERKSFDAAVMRFIVFVCCCCGLAPVSTWGGWKPGPITDTHQHVHAGHDGGGRGDRLWGVVECYVADVSLLNVINGGGEARHP